MESFSAPLLLVSGIAFSASVQMLMETVFQNLSFHFNAQWLGKKYACSADPEETQMIFLSYFLFLFTYKLLE